MGTDRPRRPAARRRSYDALIGLRVGGMAGALIGAAAAVLVGTGVVWWIVSAGVVGGVIGYAAVSRASDGDPSDSEPLDGGRR